MAIGCVLPRADPRDAFFSRSGAGLMELPPGSIVGTASPRRQALLLNLRPELKVVLLRGNVETRLGKLAAGEVDATLLAVAGLDRLSMSDRITEYLDPTLVVPAAGQGTIALEIRAGDDRVKRLVEPATCSASHQVLEAERGFVAALNGSCNSPIAAWGRIEDKAFLLHALAAKIDGTIIHRVTRSGGVPDALAIGQAAGRSLAAMLPSGFFPQ
jgi:hydroxymethylbilane synthase